ncbi:MAG: S-adenosylmethionine:tRNA ribosyltransferase-isomerase [Bacteroidales bacterium]|nr:S-adenosylmethionine:tRNA ribosyltransferase-isomerase [Bacteroidales bacterium]
MNAPKNITIEDFYYNLPDNKIAKFPLADRDKCKLLIYQGNKIEESVFTEVANLIPEDGLMVVNNTKVIPARLEFFTANGARIEIFCLEPHQPADYDSNFSSRTGCEWKCLAGNLKRWKNFNLKRALPLNGETINLEVEKVEVNGGEVIARFSWDGDHSFSDVIDAAGSIPIPPYLNRKAEESDTLDYQTIYSHYKGSVAAPTAGLHFTPQLMESLKCSTGQLTLHVGAGTFKPVKTATIGEHEMHREFFSVDRQLLMDLISHKGKITAVGTTSVRTLESIYWLGCKIISGQKVDHLSQWECYDMDGAVDMETSLNTIIKYLDDNHTDTYKASTGIMICPGYKYKVVNNIITNFHQPESTLLLLVCAAIGLEWKNLYQYALDHDFRFLSYGDSCFLKVESGGESGEFRD